MSYATVTSIEYRIPIIPTPSLQCNTDQRRRSEDALERKAGNKPHLLDTKRRDLPPPLRVYDVNFPSARCAAAVTPEDQEAGSKGCGDRCRTTIRGTKITGMSL